MNEMTNPLMSVQSYLQYFLTVVVTDYVQMIRQIKPSNVLIILFTVYIIYCIHNIFFSQYRHIPGPFISKIFPLYDLYFLIKGDFHEHLTRLHIEYGPVVRLGTNRISINSANSFKAIHNSYKFQKSSFYDHMRTTGWAMISLKSRTEHSQRRRIVSKVFSENQLASLESTIMESGVNILINKIQNGNNSLDMSKEFVYLAYDVIGKLVFSQDFGLLEGRNLYVLDWIRGLMIYVVLNIIIPPIRLYGNPYFKKIAVMAKASILKRQQQHKNQEEVPDDLLNRLILQRDPDTGEGISFLDLQEECAAMLVAGSDTTGHSLTWFLYIMLKNPTAYHKAVNEIRSKFKPGETIKYKAILSQLPYFMNCLKESLRLYPVASLPIIRVVPSGGATFDGYFIPGDTEIISNCFAMHHHPDHFINPDSFIPERWEDATPKMSASFQPFSFGPRSCVGRNLGMMELTVVMANLFLNFNVSLKEKDLTLTPICYIVLFPKAHKELDVVFTKVE